MLPEVIRKSYGIRNAYVHNGLEKPLDPNTIWVLLEIVRKFISQVIVLHKNGRRVLRILNNFLFLEVLEKSQNVSKKFPEKKEKASNLVRNEAFL